jgi:hypothetical protein
MFLFLASKVVHQKKSASGNYVSTKLPTQFSVHVTTPSFIVLYYKHTTRYATTKVRSPMSRLYNIMRQRRSSPFRPEFSRIVDRVDTPDVLKSGRTSHHLIGVGVLAFLSSRRWIASSPGTQVTVLFIGSLRLFCLRQDCLHDRHSSPS